MYSLEQWVVLQSGGPARYRAQQRGSGHVTLCDDCNNRRGGAWNVRRDGCLQRVEPTTELSDYWRALAAHEPERAVEVAAELVGREVFPGEL